MSEKTVTNAGADMKTVFSIYADVVIKTVFSRMRPTTLVAFIADMDDMSPEDYTDEDMRILHAAVIELCQVVGVSDAIQMLAAVDVSAENGVIDAAFDEVTQ